MILSLPTKSRKLRPTNYYAAFEKMKEENLTAKEQKLYDALCRVETASHYGQVILDVFTDYSVFKFRELIAELLSQRDDDSYNMYKILGKDAYDALLALKPKS